VDQAALNDDQEEYKAILAEHKQAAAGPAQDEVDPYEVSRGLRDIDQYLWSAAPKRVIPAPKTKPTGKVMSDAEKKELMGRNAAYNAERSRRELREQAERTLAAYISHEQAGGTLSDEHEQRKQNAISILGPSAVQDVTAMLAERDRRDAMRNRGQQ
jgi:hypothetical protein